MFSYSRDFTLERNEFDLTLDTGWCKMWAGVFSDFQGNGSCVKVELLKMLSCYRWSLTTGVLANLAQSGS